MNHHLRFLAGPVVFLAGVLLSSCSSAPPQTKIPSLIALPGHEITYEVRIFEFNHPADLPFQGPTTVVLSHEDGERLVAEQTGKSTFAKTTAGRFGQKRTLSNRSKFRYPTEYSAPKFAPAGQPGFPVTPASPTAYATTHIGSTVEFLAEKKNAGWVEMDVKINRKVLLGFQNYGKPITTEASDFWGKKVPIVITENRIEKPVFSSHQRATSVRLSPDQVLVICERGFRPPADLKPPLEILKGSRSPDFLAVIRIAVPEYDPR